MDYIQVKVVRANFTTNMYKVRVLRSTHTSFIENSIEAGNLLCGNDALHAMLGARTRARLQ